MLEAIGKRSVWGFAITALLALCLAIGLVGCGGSSQPSGGEQSSEGSSAPSEASESSSAADDGSSSAASAGSKSSSAASKPKAQAALHQTLSVSKKCALGVRSDGTVVAAGENDHGQCDVSGWTDIVSVASPGLFSVGLRSDGTVVATGDEFRLKDCDFSNFTDIVSISANGYGVVGVKSDGSVVGTGSAFNGHNGHTDISGLSNVAVARVSGYDCFAVLKDGTVATGVSQAQGSNPDSDLVKLVKAANWTDVVDIAVDQYHAIALKSDGTIDIVGVPQKSDEVYSANELPKSDWSDIVAVATGNGTAVGVRSDGSIITCGSESIGTYDLKDWNGSYVAAACDENCYMLVGLTQKGTVSVKNSSSYNPYPRVPLDEVAAWTDIKLP